MYKHIYYSISTAHIAEQMRNERAREGARRGGGGLELGLLFGSDDATQGDVKASCPVEPLILN